MVKKVTKLVDLNLSELSLVTRGANQHANISILKSEDAPLIEEIVKYISTADGAKSFVEYYADNKKDQRVSEISNVLWPAFSALRDSVVSIQADESLNDDQRLEKMVECVAQFVASCQHPTMGDTSDLLKYFNPTHEENMSDELKKVADLEKTVAELTKKAADAEIMAKLSDDEKAHLASLSDDDAAKFKAADAADRAKQMKKSAETDESVKGIKKSAVGEEVFAILKAQEETVTAALAKMAEASERANTVEFTKRADEEFKFLPGETIAKVAVLKGLASLDEAAQVTLTAMLKAGNDALAPAFVEIGKSGGKPSDITKAAKRDEAIAKYIAANPNVSKAVAEVAVISANPDLYEG